MDNIVGVKFAASDEDRNTKRNKKRPKFKERDKHGKKHHKKILRFIALSMVETKSTQYGNAKFSRQGLNPILSIPQRNTRESLEK